jgi:hypothetical protein
MGKYLLGTAAIGFPDVRAEYIPVLVTAQSGWFVQNAIATMDATANRPAGSLRRFEAGTPSAGNCHAPPGPMSRSSCRPGCLASRLECARSRGAAWID